MSRWLLLRNHRVLQRAPYVRTTVYGWESESWKVNADQNYLQKLHHVPATETALGGQQESCLLPLRDHVLRWGTEAYGWGTRAAKERLGGL